METGETEECPDVDLADEDVRLLSGRRLTQEVADEIVAEVLHVGRRRPTAKPPDFHVE